MYDLVKNIYHRITQARQSKQPTVALLLFSIKSDYYVVDPAILRHSIEPETITAICNRTLGCNCAQTVAKNFHGKLANNSLFKCTPALHSIVADVTIKALKTLLNEHGCEASTTDVTLKQLQFTTDDVKDKCLKVYLPKMLSCTIPHSPHLGLKMPQFSTLASPTDAWGQLVQNYRTQQNCDFTLKCADGCIKVHISVLGLYTQINGDGYVELSDISQQAAKAVLDCIYYKEDRLSDEIKKSQDALKQVLHLSHKWKLPGILHLAATAFCQGCPPEKISELEELARAYPESKQLQDTLQWMRETYTSTSVTTLTSAVNGLSLNDDGH